MPVFEGLFDTDDEDIIMDLLYLTCSAHAYAKLRIHTDATLTSQLQFTVRLGNALRRFFNEVCLKYETKELEAESQKRIRREALELTTTQNEGVTRPTRTVRRRAQKKFSMVRPKIHFLGDYIRYILEYGTTDSYSTSIVRRLNTLSPIIH